MLLLDPNTRRELGHIRIGTSGVAIGDRYLTDNGFLLDLAGSFVAAPVPAQRAWWITAGSALTLMVGEDATRAEVRGVRTKDGVPVLLGDIPRTETDGCSVDERYLVCAAPDGLHAWQFASG